MEGLDRATWFAGDLADPWVVEIAEALPRDSIRFDCPDDLPEAWPTDRPTPSSLVLHRSKLTATDAQRVARLKARPDRTPRIILCVGSHARYLDVERWSRLVDVVLAEATATETVALHALGLERKPRALGAPKPKVAIVSTNFELRTMLLDTARSAGFAVEAFADPLSATQIVATAWDVPVLEADWPATLEKLARTRPTLALIGFADRRSVSLARQAGAVACLDLPCEVADFVAVLDRIATFRHDQAHDLPLAPSAKRANLTRKR